jgi:hypothetical protein
MKKDKTNLKNRDIKYNNKVIKDKWTEHLIKGSIKGQKTPGYVIVYDIYFKRKNKWLKVTD